MVIAAIDQSAPFLILLFVRGDRPRAFFRVGYNRASIKVSIGEARIVSFTETYL